MTLQGTPKPRLRADAARNYVRIVDAARSVFGAQGLEVSLDEVARQAGVGVATLYRRFPDRQQLVTAVFEAEMQRAVELARSAMSAPDSWKALTDLLRTLFTTIAGDKGLRQALLSSRNGLGPDNVARREFNTLLAHIIERAQEANQLREGIAAEDIPTMMLMIGTVADFSSEVSPSLWKRYSEMLIDGMSRHGHPSALAMQPLSARNMARASARW